jgi:uncharacterized membrane protein YbhN (UPF0104 family)
VTADSDNSTAKRRDVWSVVKRIAAIVVVLGLMAWVIHRAWLDARTIDEEALNVQPVLIGLSAFVVLCAWCWHGALWGVMIRGLGYDLRTRTAIRASIVSNLGNYIPGKIFIVVLRAKLVEDEGVPGVIVASSIVLETLLRNMMAAILAALGLWHLGVGRSYLGGLALLLIVSIVVVHPAIFNRITDFVLKKLDRPPLPRRLKLKHLVALLLGYACYWAVYATSFYLLARGTLGAELADLPALSVALFVSLIASMMAVFTPVGLGVADATLAGVLSLTGAVTGAAVLAVIMRVWRTLTEVIVAGLGWLLPIGPKADLAEATETGAVDADGATGERTS